MDDHAHEDQDEDTDGRTTSPMQDFSTGEAGVGFVVLLVGLAVTFGLPLLL
ncbi:DUF7550 family protein [Haloplanus halobius]|uniref:DUF7550 family protein n=1 Tax=Haloplanus halobius TaxID=2934938 RepID=UPI00200FC9AA|nr:hypothetical protein [Haloplanus sp. XH21]